MSEKHSSAGTPAPERGMTSDLDEDVFCGASGGWFPDEENHQSPRHQELFHRGEKKARAIRRFLLPL